MASAARAKSAAGRAAAPSAPKANEDDGPALYPKAKYRKVKQCAKYPNGYEVRRVEDEEADALLDDKVWKDSPEGMNGDLPHGHKD